MASAASLQTAMNTDGIGGNLEYEAHSRPFSSIVQTSEFPFIVKYDSSQLRLANQPVTSSSYEPLLVHSKQSRRLVTARCVHFDRENGKIVDGDFDAVIPESNPAWFAVFGPPCAQSREPIVPHFRRVSQLAISPCTSFLLAGNTPLSVLKITKEDGEKIHFMRVEIHPGNVLKKGKLFNSSSQVKIKKKFRKKETILQEKYLSATDVNGQTYFIPCIAEGLFFVLTAVTPAQIPILKAKDIIDRYPFPVLVKLIHGQIPTPVHAFTGMFTFSTVEPVSTAMAFGLWTHTQAFFDICLDSCLPFFLCTLGAKVTQEFKDQIECCGDQLEFCLQCLRFRNKTQDLPATESATNQNVHQIAGNISSSSSSMTGYATDVLLSQSSDVTHTDLWQFSSYPTSPFPTVSPNNNTTFESNSIVILSIKQIKRSMTYERPKDLDADIIPINQGRDPGATTTNAHSTVAENQASRLRNRSKRSDSGSGSSTLSSCSQPSLSEFWEEPPLPAESPESRLYENGDMFAKGQVLEGVSDSYCGIWDLNSLKKESEYVTPFDKDVDVTDSNQNISIDSVGNTTVIKVKRESWSSCEDENGYAIASDLIELDKRDDGTSSRPASYMSVSMPENVYDTIYESQRNSNTSSTIYSATTYEPATTTISPDNTADESQSNNSTNKAPSNGNVRCSQVSTGSHPYVYLEDVPYVDIDDIQGYSLPMELPVPHHSTSSYVNDSALNVNNRESNGYQNVSKYSTLPENGKSILSDLTSSAQFLTRQVAVTTDTASLPWGKQLRRTRYPPFESGKDKETQLPAVSSSNYNTSDLRASSKPDASRDELIAMLKQHEVKKTTEEAVRALSDDDFTAMIRADEPIEKLKELLPDISKSDVFKMGMCLKGL